MMHYMLDAIFAEFDQRGIQCSVYSRGLKPQDPLYEVYKLKYEVTLSLNETDTRVSLNCSGEGYDLRAALGDAYERLTKVVDALEAKPVPDVPEPPLTDEIPF